MEEPLRGVDGMRSRWVVERRRQGKRVDEEWRNHLEERMGWGVVRSLMGRRAEKWDGYRSSEQLTPSESLRRAVLLNGHRSNIKKPADRAMTLFHSYHISQFFCQGKDISRCIQIFWPISRAALLGQSIGRADPVVTARLP